MKSLVRKSLHRLGFDLVRLQKTDAEAVADKALYKKLYHEDTVLNKRFYNIGSGGFYHPFWTNLDYVSDWYKGVQKDIVHIDLMEKGPLPVETASAEILYTSHTIEHIKDDAVQNLFNEAYRVLKPGGCFRVTTGPDADTDFEAMMRNDHDWYYWLHWYEAPGTYEEIYHKPPAPLPIEEKWLHHVATQLAPNDISPSEHKFDAAKIRELLNTMSKEALLDYLTGLCRFQPNRVGNHVSWWNTAKIMRFLKEAGFTNVYPSAYGQSQCAVLRNTKYFDNTHPQISVYVEVKR